ncbi:MAG TPA: HAD family hydrolase [Candidatus Diapherotrites archaeon]|uniref:D,D-heptose 1,7-bisphosphate phosphatase n=1 Tax=Candidatus Iainarchaeum sp. TaxID=3101447 RepID=A0A7J4J0I4_9ARCH|nr:HAD family hydrolase [Candidatus Diapherotrites archaeon]
MKNKAVFLDRDGVIIEHRHHLCNEREVEFIKGSADAIARLNKDFKVIVVSNQSVVARGIATRAEVRQINAFIKKSLAESGARIDAIYFCPHHPEHSGKCPCRKPDIGMLLEAKKRYKIDFTKSYFVGDSTTDIKTGENAGCTTILVKTGYGGHDGIIKVKPSMVARDLAHAAQKICGKRA